MKNNIYNKNDIDVISEAYESFTDNSEDVIDNSITPEDAEDDVEKSPFDADDVPYLMQLSDYIHNFFNKKGIKNIKEQIHMVELLDGMFKDYCTYYLKADINNEDAEDIYDVEAEIRPGKKYGEKSFLDVKIEDIYGAKTFEEAAELFRNFAKASKINPKNKAQILANIDKIEAEGGNLVRLQTYATNCMFKMKKMGLK